MKRVATMSVIRGEGQCEAIVNGVVQQELRRLQEISKRQLDDERELIRAELKQLRGENAAMRYTRGKHNRERLTALEDDILGEPIKWRQRLIWRVSDGWGLFWATAVSLSYRAVGRRL